jgi:hypothetical protein
VSLRKGYPGDGYRGKCQNRVAFFDTNANDKIFGNRCCKSPIFKFTKNYDDISIFESKEISVLLEIIQNTYDTIHIYFGNSNSSLSI